MLAGKDLREVYCAHTCFLAMESSLDTHQAAVVTGRARLSVFSASIALETSAFFMAKVSPKPQHCSRPASSTNRCCALLGAAKRGRRQARACVVRGNSRGMSRGEGSTRPHPQSAATLLRTPRLWAATHSRMIGARHRRLFDHDWVVSPIVTMQLEFSTTTASEC